MSVVLSPELKYVTEERLLEWKNPNPSGSSRVADPVPMTRFLYELCWAMVSPSFPSILSLSLHFLFSLLRTLEFNKFNFPKVAFGGKLLATVLVKILEIVPHHTSIIAFGLSSNGCYFDFLYMMIELQYLAYCRIAIVPSIAQHWCLIKWTFGAIETWPKLNPHFIYATLVGSTPSPLSLYNLFSVFLVVRYMESCLSKNARLHWILCSSRKIHMVMRWGLF